MSNFHYVYIPVDESTGTHFYTGCTGDLKSRLEKHNKGDVPHTSKYRPWRIKNAIAFDDREKAYAFEAYLKTHSGRTFAERMRIAPIFSPIVGKRELPVVQYVPGRLFVSTYGCDLNVKCTLCPPFQAVE